MINVRKKTDLVMPTLAPLARLGLILTLASLTVLALPALASAQESGPPYSFPGCTEQADGTFDCGYQGPEGDLPPNCSRPTEGGQLRCYPGGLEAQAGPDGCPSGAAPLAGETAQDGSPLCANTPVDTNDTGDEEEPRAPDDTCLAPGTPEFEEAGCDSDDDGEDISDPELSSTQEPETNGDAGNDGEQQTMRAPFPRRSGAAQDLRRETDRVRAELTHGRLPTGSNRVPH